MVNVEIKKQNRKFSLILIMDGNRFESARPHKFRQYLNSLGPQIVSLVIKYENYDCTHQNKQKKKPK